MEIDLSVLEGTTALVVDDEPKIREMFKLELEDYQVKIHEAQNGKEALELIKNNKIDFVISDIRMPGGSGIEFLEEFSKLKTNKPKMIMISGFSDLTPSRAKDLGAIDLVPKPCNIQNVLKLIAKSIPKAGE